MRLSAHSQIPYAETAVVVDGADPSLGGHLLLAVLLGLKSLHFKNEIQL
jgi:hypothetical protein